MFDIGKSGMAGDGHTPVFMTRNGSMISERDWPKFRRLARDELPESPRLPTSDKRPRLSRDEHEERVNQLRRYLDSKGRSAADADAACRILADELGEPAEDELPVSGPKHALTAREHREPGEKVFRDDDAAFDAMYPGLRERIKPAYGYGQFDSLQHDRSTRRERRIAADAAANAEAHLLEMYGPDGPARIGTGLFPPRR
jgi:hypothetical protein